jgi:hypothetical protein
MMFPATMDKRYALQKQAPTRTFNLPAPTGGINARDALTDMDEHDAVDLTNIFPEAGYCVLRKGNASWATGLGGPIRSFLTWNGLDGTDKIFGGAGTSLFDVTASGAVGAAVITGLTNVDFQWTNIKTAAGAYLAAVNGADSMRAFDGTSWSTPAITGATSSTFANVCQFKERLWFSVANSLDLYYLGIQSVAGAATVFPLGAVFHRGGHVVGLGTFSNDSGEGPDDYFCIVSSNGEIAVYQGTDPSSATTWSLVGRFDVGPPIGRRCTIRWNGDLSILTQDGVISMQAALRFSRESEQKAAITGKIQTLFSTYASAYSGNFGWMLCTYPKARYLIVNVPTVENSAQIQLVMNTITGAWTRFVNLNGGCWGVANDLLYFGGNDGTVYQANDGFLDVMAPIPWEIQTSWQQVWGASNKRFTMVRPTLLVGVGISYAITVDVDFQITTPTGILAPLANPFASMTWGWTWPGTWGGQNIVDQRWQTVGSLGTWASVHILGSSNGGSLQCNAFELGAMRGGPL